MYIVKLVYRFLLTSSTFTTVSFVRFSFFLFVKTNLNGEDAVNVPHLEQKIVGGVTEFLCLSSKEEFCGIFV